MIKKIDFHISALDSMKSYPKNISYIGNLNLLNNKKIAIVGTRKPNSYTKNIIHNLSHTLSNNNITIVSGAAMGVDAIAHSASNNNTIAVVANGLNIRYPAVNKSLIQNIEKNSLILSTYKDNEKARNYTFVHRNEIVVALCDILIVAQADLNSGSLTSAKFALKMNKAIYVLPHRINESLGTQELIKNNQAKVIYDIDEFIKSLGISNVLIKKDDFLDYCKSNPLYNEALTKYGDKIFEYELEGKIIIKDSRVFIN